MISFLLRGDWIWVLIGEILSFLGIFGVLRDISIFPWEWGSLGIGVTTLLNFRKI